MPRLLDRLWLLLATATDRQLTRMIEYLKAENRILRDRLPDKISVTPAERRRLMRYGKPLGAAIRELITIVHPRTFFRWVARDKPAGTKTPTRAPRRPKTAEPLRELVLRLAKETGWGYTRILGELRKLGVRGVCRSTVVNILKEAGLDPSPERKKGTWSEFVRRHAATLWASDWASDFVGVKAWTRKGLVDLYLLFFIHVDSRRVFVGGITAHPDGEWATQQARNASMQFAEWGLPCSHLLIDHDTKYVAGFDQVLEAEGVEVKRVGPRAPNLNAFAERWVQSLRTECLDRFVVLGERHLRHLVGEYLAHYNAERPHQGKGNAPLGDSPPSADPGAGEADAEDPVVLPFPARVECRERLGGLLKHYRRAA